MPKNNNNNFNKGTKVPGALKGRLVLKVWLITVLIQHIAHVAHAAQKSASSKSMPLLKLDMQGGFSEGHEEKPTLEDYSDDETELNAQDTTGDYVGNSQIDLGAYGNDFNMQDEATIPKDILDQKHMQDVDVMDGTSALKFHSSVDQDAADFLVKTSSTNNRNFSTDKNPTKSKEKAINENTMRKLLRQKVEEKENGKPVENVAGSFLSIGPVIFHARSLSRQKNSEIDEWHSNDKDVEKRQQQQKQQQQQHETKAKLKNLTKYNNKLLLEQYAHNKYNNNNKQISMNSGNTMKLDKMAIGDIEEESSNEDASFYYNNENSNYKINDKTNIGRIKHVNDQLVHGRILIDSDKSISDVTRLKIPAQDVNMSAQISNVNALKVHEGMQTILPFGKVKATTSNITSNIQMKSVDDNNRSKKHRRHLPEMNFGHQREDIDLNDNKDDLISIASDAVTATMLPRGVDDNFEKNNKLPADGSDNSRRDYFGIWKTGTNGMAGNTRVQSKNEGNSFDVTGTLIDQDLRTDEALGMMNQKEGTVSRNPSPFVRGDTFEQYKAVHRYNRRNGHKTHKKKYKDFLRHAWAVTNTNPRETETTESVVISDKIDIAIDNNNNGNVTTTKSNKKTIENEWKENRQRQRAQKLQAEKSRGFRVPPIFVLTSAAQSTKKQHETLSEAQNMKNTTTTIQNKMKILDKPFYEGQINYYLETKDVGNDDFGQGHIDMNENGSKIDHKVFDSSESSSSWYNRVGPMLRNGLRTASQNQDIEKDVAAISRIHKNTYEHQEHQENHLHHRNRQNHEHMKKQKHHHHNHERGEPQHHVHHFSHAFHHSHHQKHHPKSQQHERQKQSMTAHVKKENYERADYITLENAQTQAPYPPPNHKRTGNAPTIGHQITELEDFERYYAKWPHLARVQFQVYDEHMREEHAQQEQQQKQHKQPLQEQKEDKSQSEDYPEYEYESIAELEEAQKANAEDANLPPYIRKYNRRNKQLLNLLEGPLPPPQGYHWSGSKLQPGPLESSSDASIVRVDDEYIIEKRKRYHQSHNNKVNDLFAKQRASNESISEITLQPTLEVLQNATTANLNQLAARNNYLPDENVNISAEDMKHDNWKKEIESKIKTKWQDVKEIIGNVAQINNWRIEKLVTPTSSITTLSNPNSSSTQTPKSLVFRLPAFNNDHGTGYSMRQRSRSAHSAASPGQRRHVSGFLDSMELHGYSENQEVPIASQPNKTTHPEPSTTTATDIVAFHNPPTPQPTPQRPKMPTIPPRSISAFVYHRVVDDSSPRIVGTGLGVQGRKQQLPFVAITDRRLETFKKSLLERQKEFEQNNFPPLP